MKLSKLSVAVASLLGAGFSANALAIDLYVDTKTQQLFAEPGPGRVKLGSFEKVEERTEAQALEQKALDEKIEDKIAKHQRSIESAPGFADLKMTDKGIEFASKDGNFKMAINGRMQVDSQMNVNGNKEIAPPGTDNKDGVPTAGTTNNTLADGTNIRRARLGVEGSFYKDYEYKFEYDFSRGNGSAAGGITDAYLNWVGLKNCDKEKADASCGEEWLKPLSIKVGQFKEPFSLEEATSNRYLTFIERNMAVNTFSDNPNAYKVGLAVNYATPRWTATGAIQTEPVGGGWAYNSSVNNTITNSNTGATNNNINGNNNRNNGSGDTGWDLTGRVTGLPWIGGKNEFLHVGASGSKRFVNNNYDSLGNFNNGSMVFTGTFANVDRTAILNTGTLTNGKQNAPGSHEVSSITRFGGESALVYGPFSAQAEYIQATVSGNGYKDETLKGYYGYMSYFLTGESRNYKAKTGAWDRIKPQRDFDMKGGWGAWEVAGGYDYLNLTDGAVHGGRMQTAKFGLNWYPTSHVRLMANLIHVLNVETSDVSSARSKAFNNSNMDVVEVRAQVDF